MDWSTAITLTRLPTSIHDAPAFNPVILPELELHMELILGCSGNNQNARERESPLA
jgi:hypothetical protein